MDNLREVYSEKLFVLEEASKDGELVLSAIFAEADKPNKNGRMYPEKVLKRAIEKLQKKIEKDNSVLASAGHTTEMSINNVSHMIEDVWFNEKDKTAQANIRILPTSEGQNVATIINHGGKLGLSMAGLGTVTKKESYSQVNDDYELKQIDIVVNPGFEGAGFSAKDIIGESLDLDKALKDDKKFHEEREDY